MTERVIVIVMDAELLRSLEGSARSRPGCHVPSYSESEWRQTLKEAFDESSRSRG